MPNKASTNVSTPKALGFRMPAEWEPHAATWIAWPHNPTDWPGKFPPIPWAYAEIVRYLARVERVCILVNDVGARKKATEVLRKCHVNLDAVQFYLWPTNRVWTRDSGPIFVRDTKGKVAITNWHFNAWAKYPDWKLDDQIPGRVAKTLQLEQWKPETIVNAKPRRLVLEGGSIDVNGAGCLLTTEECLLSEVQQRNPGVAREQLEHAFSEYLGIEKVIWLNRGCAGDDTHGHVDDIARFVAKDTILATIEPNRADENHEPLQENLDRLHAARDQHGKPFKVVELPMPAPVVFRDQRLPASYANFYVANNLVLVPTFNDPNDRKALNILAEVFPDRNIVGIYCGDFIWGLGAIHCATQQQPG